MEINKWAANNKLGQLALALMKIRDQDVVVKTPQPNVPALKCVRKCMCCEVVAMPDITMKHQSEPFSDGADNPCFIAQQALLRL